MRTVDTFTPKITFIGIIESQTDHIYHKTAEDIADDSVDNFIINAGYQTDPLSLGPADQKSRLV